jgi:hypothetical protein
LRAGSTGSEERVAAGAMDEHKSFLNQKAQIPYQSTEKQRENVKRNEKIIIIDSMKRVCYN